jgi:hypothetical protein
MIVTEYGTGAICMQAAAFAPVIDDKPWVEALHRDFAVKFCALLEWQGRAIIAHGEAQPVAGPCCFGLHLSFMPVTRTAGYPRVPGFPASKPMSRSASPKCHFQDHLPSQSVKAIGFAMSYATASAGSQPM